MLCYLKQTALFALSSILSAFTGSLFMQLIKIKQYIMGICKLQKKKQEQDKIIGYRATATLRRPKIKQYTAEKEVRGTKPTLTTASYNFDKV